MVRNRAFASTSEANVDGFISKCGSVLEKPAVWRGRT